MIDISISVQYSNKSFSVVRFWNRPVKLNLSGWIVTGWILVTVFLLGSGEGHIETTRVIQEADALMLIGTNTRQDDEIFLSALEGIHTGNFHLL